MAKSEFEKKFALARKMGAKTFVYKGKRYNTELAKDGPTKPKGRPTAKKTTTPKTSPKPKARPTAKNKTPMTGYKKGDVTSRKLSNTKGGRGDGMVETVRRGLEATSSPSKKPGTKSRVHPKNKDRWSKVKSFFKHTTKDNTKSRKRSK